MQSASGDRSAFEQLVELLQSHGVEFLVIGGQAETLMGSSRVTYDADFCYARTPENLERLAAALAELKPSLRDAPRDLPVRFDAKALALGSNYTLDTALGPVDLFAHVEPIGGFEQLNSQAEEYELGDLRVRTIALEDLIRVKASLKRAKDQESLRQLQAIKRLRNERN